MTIETLSKRNFKDNEYPVNVLRNIALRNVATSHVMYVDIDFWPSDTLYHLLNLPSVKKQWKNDSKTVLVIPSFQICWSIEACIEENDFKLQMPHNADEIISWMKQKNDEHHVSVFDPSNRGGHGSTPYGMWIKMREGEIMDLKCIKSNRYEPYMAFRLCDDIPPFQECFKGYGKNKMTQVMHMRRTGYKFKVLGGGFITHFPHDESKSRSLWNEGQDVRDNENGSDEERNIDWTTYKRGQVDQLFAEFKKWMENEVPDNSRTKLCNDAATDDFRLWVN